MKLLDNGKPASKYQVEVIDTEYYQRQISCQNACPVRTDARGYVNAVADGDYETGYIQARQPNPFTSICGRVCAAHCEKACRRGNIDAPIAIRALKRFLCETHGVEAMSHLPLVRGTKDETGTALLSAQTLSNASTIESFGQLSREKTDRGEVGEIKVAVIGAGPSGLTAAHDLALLGYKVTVFETSSVVGGMVMLGIPEFRMQRDLLKAEIKEILDLGVELRTNTRLGSNITLSGLKEQGFKAIFLGIGAHKDTSLDLEGRELDGVIPAVDFLLNVNMGYRVDLGDSVSVIGGGDVAIDAARVASRLGEVYGQLASGDLVTATDTARAALRLGARDVHIVYRGTREEMRATKEEVEGALEEGTIIHNSLTPVRIIGEDGKVTGLETVVTRSDYDSQGRRTLVPVPGSEAVIKCTSVILATGQGSDLSFINTDDKIEISNRSTIVADADTLATTSPGIYAGGDVVYGPRTIIEAVADGHRAARGIDSYLRGGQGEVVRRGWLREVSDNDLPTPGFLDTPRANPGKISLERRTGVSEVEQVYDKADAVEQAERCLKCNIQTVFNSELCILCGGCVDVCPQSCYKMVSLDKIQGDDSLDAAVMDKYGVSLEDFQQGSELPGQGTAMIKDETRCVRCGLCAKRCPTQAITMQSFWFEEELSSSENAEKTQEGAGSK